MTILEMEEKVEKEKLEKEDEEEKEKEEENNWSCLAANVYSLPDICAAAELLPSR